MSRNCSICASDQAEAVRQAVLNRETDAAIAERHGFSRAAIQRHRVSHIEAPARHVAAIAAKGHDATVQRAALACATAEDPRVWLALDAITGDLRKVHDRLDRAADQAALAGQGMTLSSLSGQLIRANEARAKLGGAGQEAGKLGSGFSVRIFLGEEQPVTIEADGVVAGPDIEPH